MNKQFKKHLCISLSFLAAFLLWTAAVKFVDVQSIGPMDTSVGLASVNRFFHEITGVHMWLYAVTDWLGLIPLAFVLFFAIFGLGQWIKRGHLFRVDGSILALGVFYILVFGAYILFEELVINYRPVLIEGRLEASYPSSTTMLVLCVIPTAILQFHSRIQKPVLRKYLLSALLAFAIFMVVGRVISGVHWLTDILGGALLSAGLVTLYYTATSSK